ncbi:MAG: nucleotidyltransferase family protein [Deltaproteobacteria bacterium]
MAQPPRSHSLLLLDLVSPSAPVDEQAIRSLGEQGWAAILRTASQHRLEPLLHWQLSRLRPGLPVPVAVRDDLKRTFKAHTLRSLEVQWELPRLHHILTGAGIPYVALKGAFLAFHAYPHPALRPLRDLDLLVPADRVMDANRVLRVNGFTQHELKPGDPEAWANVIHHLPPLRAPSGIFVEIHHGLARSTPEDGGLPDPDGSRRFWERCIRRQFEGEEIPYESPTDLLLHLVVHGAFHHRFENGPLLLSDVAMLLEAEPIDWRLFWTLAAQAGATRGCVLVFRLTMRQWGELPVEWPAGLDAGADALGAQMDNAAAVMVWDADARRGLATGDALAERISQAGFLGAWLGRIFPPRNRVAFHFPVSARSPTIVLWYFAYWWWSIRERFPAYVRSRRKSGDSAERRQLAELSEWLAGSHGQPVQPMEE